MGKGALLLVAAAMIGGSMTLFQANRTSIETTEGQSDRQEVILAREVARSGYNYAKSLAREAEATYKGNNPNKTLPVNTLVQQINGAKGYFSGKNKGGTYKAWLTVESTGGYRVNSEGRFGDAMHLIGRPLVSHGMLMVPGMGLSFKARFLNSEATYCSAVYLEQAYRKGNQGGGNNYSGVDSKTEYNDNADEKKINGSKKLVTMEPELIYSSGNWRNGAEALYEKEVPPATLLNFILAVDVDCDLQGKDVPVTDSRYEWTHTAFAVGASTIDEMVEGKNVMLEKHPSKPDAWRVAFEDLNHFSDAQHEDVKKNGYGNASWGKVKGSYTYGGSGWSNRDSEGYYDLKNYGSIPDFSDQVFEIELVKAKENGNSVADVADNGNNGNGKGNKNK